MPSTPAFKTCDWKLTTKTYSTESPFTGQKQYGAGLYFKWSGTVSLPPMKRAQAQAWIAFLANCEGGLNYFTMANPDAPDGGLGLIYLQESPSVPVMAP